MSPDDARPTTREPEQSLDGWAPRDDIEREAIAIDGDCREVLGGYVCTRRARHDDDHVAGGTRPKVYARWPNAAPPVTQPTEAGRCEKCGGTATRVIWAPSQSFLMCDACANGAGKPIAEPAPTTQRSPLPPREQAAISVLLLHDACAAAGLQPHIDLVAEQVRNDLAEVQMSVEVLWQGYGLVAGALRKHLGPTKVPLYGDAFGIDSDALPPGQPVAVDYICNACGNGVDDAGALCDSSDCELSSALRASGNTDDPYHHALAAIARVVGLVEGMRGGK